MSTETTAATTPDAAAATDPALGADAEVESGSILGGEAEAGAAGDGEPNGQSADEPERDGAGEGDGEKAADVDYEFSLPDDMPVDEDGLTWAKTEFKELGIPKEKAQGLVDRHIQGLKAAQERQMQAWEQQKGEWAKAVRTDPELGGANLQETTRLGNAAIKAAGFDKDTVQLMEHAGLLGHPGFIRGMRKLGGIVSDDRFVEAAGTATERSIADRLYGTD